MNHLIAVDDGIAAGNYNAADICFLIAVIIFILAALITAAPSLNRPDGGPGRYGTPLVYLGSACVALGLLLL